MTILTSVWGHVAHAALPPSDRHYQQSVLTIKAEEVVESVIAFTTVDGKVVK
jgi:hypothetical protein